MWKRLLHQTTGVSKKWLVSYCALVFVKITQVKNKSYCIHKTLIPCTLFLLIRWCTENSAEDKVDCIREITLKLLSKIYNIEIFSQLISNCFLFSTVLLYLKIYFYENILLKIIRNVLYRKNKFSWNGQTYLISENIFPRNDLKIVPQKSILVR